jgi:uncharacterized protein YjeT (DUF2065 family)
LGGRFFNGSGASRGEIVEVCPKTGRRHSGAMQSIEPGISRFPDAQLRIWGLVLRTIPE